MAEELQKLVKFLLKHATGTGFPFHRLTTIIGGDPQKAVEVVVEAVRRGILEQTVVVATSTEFLGQFDSILSVPEMLPGHAGDVTVLPEHLHICYRNKIR